MVKTQFSFVGYFTYLIELNYWFSHRLFMNQSMKVNSARKCKSLNCFRFPFYQLIFLIQIFYFEFCCTRVDFVAIAVQKASFC